MKDINFETKHILPPQEAKEFFFGGNAIFTVESQSTGGTITFKVQKRDGHDRFFVRVMYDYMKFSYIGYIFDKNRREFQLGMNPRITKDADSYKVISWLLRHFSAPEDKMNLNGCNFYHHGICGRCGAVLTRPESIDNGFGPVCIKLQVAA